MTGKEQLKEMGFLYPQTIVLARYGGVYEGGKYLAFNQYVHNLPAGWDEDDCSCADCFRDLKEHVGRGKTPDAALADLIRRITDDTPFNEGAFEWNMEE